MKILQLASLHYWPPSGGTERYLWNLCQALDGDGHHCTLAYDVGPSLGTGQRPEYRIPNSCAHVGQLDHQVEATVRDILIHHSVQVVHLHGMWNPALIRWLAERVPLVCSVHEHSLHCPAGSKYFRTTSTICTHPFGPRCISDALLKGCNSRRPNRLWHTYRRTAAMRAVEPYIDHFVTPSAFTKDCLERNGYPSEKISVLQYFTEFSDQPMTSPQPSPGPEKVVLFVGRVVREKGWREFLLALRELKTPFYAVVCGDGPDLPAMKALCARLGLTRLVDFRGWLSPEEQVECYRRASVVVVPSIWPEPFGLVGIEAMSFAKPVVAFRVGAIPEWLEDRVTGFLADPGNVQQMGEKISYLLQHPTIGHEIGRAGRRRVKTCFARDSHIRQLGEIYERVSSS